MSKKIKLEQIKTMKSAILGLERMVSELEAEVAKEEPVLERLHKALYRHIRRHNTRPQGVVLSHNLVHRLWKEVSDGSATRSLDDRVLGLRIVAGAIEGYAFIDKIEEEL